MQRIALATCGRSVAAAAGVGIAQGSGLRAGVPRPAPQTQRLPDHNLVVEEGADGWDVVHNPVSRAEVSQALGDIATLGGVAPQEALLLPPGAVLLEDVTSDTGSWTTEGSEANAAMYFAEPDAGAPGSPAGAGAGHGPEGSLVATLTGLLNNPSVMGPIQEALERDPAFARLLTELNGTPRLTGPPAAAGGGMLTLEGMRSAPMAEESGGFIGLMEGLAAGINEAAARLGDAFAKITELLRSLGDALRHALDSDGPAPAVYGAPGPSGSDPRVARAVSRLALAVAVFIVFRRLAPGILLRL